MHGVGGGGVDLDDVGDLDDGGQGVLEVGEGGDFACVFALEPFEGCWIGLDVAAYAGGDGDFVLEFQ